MDMAETVPAAEFARNFGRYKLQPQREAVPVSSNGRIVGYFVAADQFDPSSTARFTKILSIHGNLSRRDALALHFWGKR